MSEIPRDYLEWLWKANDDVNKIVRAELDRRDALESAQMPLIGKIVHAGYRSMALKAHPDG